MAFHFRFPLPIVFHSRPDQYNPYHRTSFQSTSPDHTGWRTWICSVDLRYRTRSIRPLLPDGLHTACFEQYHEWHVFECCRKSCNRHRYPPRDGLTICLRGRKKLPRVLPNHSHCRTIVFLRPLVFNIRRLWKEWISIHEWNHFTCTLGLKEDWHIPYGINYQQYALNKQTNHSDN